ncbi:hypothetical protein ACA910_010207 [Epithemia clementina (nom. ined.)]
MGNTAFSATPPMDCWTSIDNDRTTKLDADTGSSVPVKEQMEALKMHGLTISTVSLAHSATLICLKTEDKLVCGAPIGTSGKFCTAPKSAWRIKAHLCTPSYLTLLSRDGIQEAIFINEPPWLKWDKQLLSKNPFWTHAS